MDDFVYWRYQIYGNEGCAMRKAIVMFASPLFIAQPMSIH